MFNLGSQELLIIGAVVILLFGGNKIPELMRGLGSGMREFKSALDSPETPGSKPASDSPEQGKKDDEQGR